MALTQAQVKVYEVIFNMVMRLVLTCAGICAFFMVLSALLDGKHSQDKGTYLFLETLIAGTTFWPYRFYFSFGNKQASTTPPAVPSVPSQAPPQAPVP